MAQFTNETWKETLAQLALVVGAEAQRYAANPAARLVAAIAYVADSQDPDRFALSNLLTFHAATKARALFDHRDGDNGDVLRRLATLQYGSKADAKAVAHGLNLLALISLNDHEHDLAADKAAGKDNPVASGQWDAKVLRKDLEAKVAADSALKAAYHTAVGSDASVQGFWID